MELKIDNTFLDAVENRSLCPQCGASRRYFCYSCCIPLLPSIAPRLPKVQYCMSCASLGPTSHEYEGCRSTLHNVFSFWLDLELKSLSEILEYSAELTMCAMCDLLLTGASDQPSYKQCNAFVVLKKIMFPFKVDIVKHANERDGKSTGVHCALLAPDHVTMFEYPHFPDYSACSKTVLLYPDPSAPTLGEYFESSDSQGASLEKCVLLDCTWSQAFGIITHPFLSKLPRIQLEPHLTQFWRPQHKRQNTDLATVEAVYYLLLEYHKHVLKRNYVGEYDQLMLFYDHFLRRIKGTGFVAM